ncbi:FAD-dependent monooxygenase [Amycolatopsis sp. NBC_00345]|uniref:FAD-dependent monooxygenase n=1 Tax=Amycolatopsis sp. NBC_00345 TaxID=2975955 RepID=UPI002E26D141
MRDRLAQHAKVAELSPGPNVLCPQDVLEPVLRKAALERGVSLRFATELTSFTQDETGVTAWLRPAGGPDVEVTLLGRMHWESGTGSPPGGCSWPATPRT